jgi:hypothetical protein
MDTLRKKLVERLESMGMDSNIIPGFIRSLSNAVLVNSHMNLLQVNKRLNWLGWDGIELDYHTFQLAKACLEAEGSKEADVALQRGSNAPA